MVGRQLLVYLLPYLLSQPLSPRLLWAPQAASALESHWSTRNNPRRLSISTSWHRWYSWRHPCSMCDQLCWRWCWHRGRILENRSHRGCSTVYYPRQKPASGCGCLGYNHCAGAMVVACDAAGSLSLSADHGLLIMAPAAGALAAADEEGEDHGALDWDSVRCSDKCRNVVRTDFFCHLDAVEKENRGLRELRTELTRSNTLAGAGTRAATVAWALFGVLRSIQGLGQQGQRRMWAALRA